MWIGCSKGFAGYFTTVQLFGSGLSGLGKTKNGERKEIPINETLRGTLQGLIRRLDIPFVFHDPSTGKPYHDVKRSFKTALRRAGIKDFKFHDLRHTFASHLVMAGVDLTTVSRLLGHRTLTMTLSYAHLAPSHKVKAVGILDNALNGQPTDRPQEKACQLIPTAQLLHKKEVISHV